MDGMDPQGHRLAAEAAHALVGSLRIYERPEERRNLDEIRTLLEPYPVDTLWEAVVRLVVATIVQHAPTPDDFDLQAANLTESLRAFAAEHLSDGERRVLAAAALMLSTLRVDEDNAVVVEEFIDPTDGDNLYPHAVMADLVLAIAGAAVAGTQPGHSADWFATLLPQIDQIAEEAAHQAGLDAVGDALADADNVVSPGWETFEVAATLGSIFCRCAPAGPGAEPVTPQWLPGGVHQVDQVLDGLPPLQKPALMLAALHATIESMHGELDGPQMLEQVKAAARRAVTDFDSGVDDLDTDLVEMIAEAVSRTTLDAHGELALAPIVVPSGGAPLTRAMAHLVRGTVIAYAERQGTRTAARIVLESNATHLALFDPRSPR